MAKNTAVLQYDVKLPKETNGKTYWAPVGTLFLNLDEDKGSLYLNMFKDRFLVFKHQERLERGGQEEGKGAVIPGHLLNG